jgi:HK97 family phage major capsid protein
MKSCSQFLAELDRASHGVRRKVGRLHYAAHKSGAGAEFFAALRDCIREITHEERATSGDPKQRLLADPHKRLLLSGMVRRVCGIKPAEEEQEVMDQYKRAIGEDATPGSTLVVEHMGRDIFDVLAATGKWATLGVRPITSKSNKFPVTTVLPTVGFVLTEGNTLPEDGDFAGTSVSAEAEVFGCLLPVSEQLVQDLDRDLAVDLLEKFERGGNARLDHAAFNGNGTADATHGGMTGLFQNGDVTSVTAAAGNTTFEELEYEDFVAVLEAAPAGVLQRRPRWWMHPTHLARALRIKEPGGAPMVKTILDQGGASLFSILGFPVELVAAAPSTNAAATKVAVFGEPGGYLVGIRQEWLVQDSGHYKWNTFQRTFRMFGRARAAMRDATAFIALKTATA